MATPKKLTLKNTTVLTLEQELLIINKLIQVQDIDKASRELATSTVVVRQVALKYADVLAIFLANNNIAAQIQDAYSKTIKTVLDTNDKVISLLAHQIDCLYAEYMSEENKSVLLKDYIIKQILDVQDRLQKMIDSGLNRYKDAIEILNKRLIGFDKKDNDDTEDNSYAENSKAVFEKLTALDVHMSRIVAINNTTGVTKIFNKVFEAARFFGVQGNDFKELAEGNRIPGWTISYETKEA